MRRAYVMHRGRVVPADEIAYDDCIDDRVVCEMCGNRVFKCVRGQGADALHYLSHYVARSDESRRCEARIEARMRSERSHDDAISRGQALRDRLGSLDRILSIQDPETAIIARDVAEACSTIEIERMVRHPMPGRMLRSAATRGFRSIASEMGHHTDVVAGASSMDVTDALVEIGSRFPEMDARRTDSPFHRDALGLLIMTESMSALDDLFHHAAARVAYSDASTDEVRDAAVAHLGLASDKRMQGTEVPVTATRDAIMLEMMTLLRGVDPAMPVPRVMKPPREEDNGGPDGNRTA